MISENWSGRACEESWFSTAAGGGGDVGVAIGLDPCGFSAGEVFAEAGAVVDEDDHEDEEDHEDGDFHVGGLSAGGV